MQPPGPSDVHQYASAPGPGDLPAARHTSPTPASGTTSVPISPPLTGRRELSEDGRHYDVVNVVALRPAPSPGAAGTMEVRRGRVASENGKLIPDHVIAQRGFTPYAHTDQIEYHLTDSFTVDVRPDATFVIDECATPEGGVPSKLRPREVSAAAFRRSYAKVATVLTLDPHGRVVRAETDGGC